MFSRFLNFKLLKGAAPVISRCLLNTYSEGAKRTLPTLEYYNLWNYKGNYKINTPSCLNNQIFLPNVLTWVFPVHETPNVSREIIDPVFSDNSPKEAARLIVIRRKKMKKHKLRKLRKRMKFEWGKLRQKREFRKEKEFQAVLIRQCKEAEAFSAEKYVDEKLNKLHETLVPRYWKGKRLPEFIIREKMGLPPK